MLILALLEAYLLLGGARLALECHHRSGFLRCQVEDQAEEVCHLHRRLGS